MNFETNLNGRLRNTHLPASQALMPLFEAVVNSIHSIEDSLKDISKCKITIEILRKESDNSIDYDNPSNKIGINSIGEIKGFKIEDDGIGFNDVNFNSFKTLDSEHKIDKGCRGIGRLLWLKAFDSIDINSNYKFKGIFYNRCFEFNAKGVELENDYNIQANIIKTIVYLKGFKEKYRLSSVKTTYKIAESLLEHCLWYFIRDAGIPKIIVKDNNESINLFELYDEYMFDSSSHDKINIKGINFNITHVKSKPSSSKFNSIAFIASSRFVKEEGIDNKISGLYGTLNDGVNNFIYTCYISSDFLDERVRPERTGLDIIDNVDGLISDIEISYNDINNVIFIKIKKYLNEYIKKNIEASQERINNFISHKAPRYKSIVSRISNEQLNINPSTSDKDLDLILHGHLYNIEKKVLEDGHLIMHPKQNENHRDYKERVHEYLTLTEDIKKSDLANYVSHRKVILDLLEMAIQKDDNGKYSREDLIHDLIMPMNEESNNLKFEDMNLWLLDERLAFHNYLASDKTFNSMPITDSLSTQEPDIIALQIRDNPILVSNNDNNLPLASLVVIEIKRPMRNDMRAGRKDNPIEQILDYLEKIRKSKVTTALGRPIVNAANLPGFCYIVADLTPTLIKRCKTANLTANSDCMGYFGFNKEFETYIEVISYDKLVQSAKERNKAFFDKLGLPTT